jgi:hypothetical protein
MKVQDNSRGFFLIAPQRPLGFSDGPKRWSPGMQSSIAAGVPLAAFIAGRPSVLG